MGANGPILTQTAMKVIVESLRSVYHGTVALIIQDSRLLQIDRCDKIRLDSAGLAKGLQLDTIQTERLRQQLQEKLKDLAFGQVALTVKGGILVQIERMEKQRYSSLEGIYGDGI